MGFKIENSIKIKILIPKSAKQNRLRSFLFLKEIRYASF